MTSFYTKEETLVTVLVCVFLNAYLKKKKEVFLFFPPLLHLKLLLQYTFFAHLSTLEDH